MKFWKITGLIVFSLVIALPVLAADTGSTLTVLQKIPYYQMVVLGAPIGLGAAAAGGGIGMGHVVNGTVLSTARNPGLGGKLMTLMMIGLAMIEAQVIYTLVIVLLLLFTNPFGI